MHQVNKAACPFSEYQQETLQGKLYCSPKGIDGIFRADGVPTSSLPRTRGHFSEDRSGISWISAAHFYWANNNTKCQEETPCMHKESLMVEMITGASDSLGKYYPFRQGFLDPWPAWGKTKQILTLPMKTNTVPVFSRQRSVPRDQTCGSASGGRSQGFL